jgi:hypothetical protein
MLAPSAGFRSLRDGERGDQSDLERRRFCFDYQVYPTLQGQGFAREELLLAWEFHTASEDNTLGRIRWMREDALARSAEGASMSSMRCMSEAVRAFAALARSIEGRLTAPMYTEEVGPPTVLTRDENGMPYANGETEVLFIVQIPCSLLEEQREGRLVQFGHGLLGWYEESRDDYLEELTDENDVRGSLARHGPRGARRHHPSADFLTFVILLDQTMADQREVTLFVNGLAQDLWDPAEAGGWLYAMNESPEFFPKDVRLHVAIGDAEVPVLGAHMMARAFGADSVAPQVRSIFGIDEREEDFTGSAIVEWRYVDTPEVPEGPTPPSSTFSPHECLRRQPMAMAQVGTFINTGKLLQPCAEACTSVYCGL